MNALLSKSGFPRAVLLAVMLLVCVPVSAQEAGPLLAVRVTVSDQAGRLLAAAQAQLKLNGVPVTTAETDEKGIANLVAPSPGIYEIVVFRRGYEPLVQSGVEVQPLRPVEAFFTLTPSIELKETVSISARADAPLEQTSPPPVELRPTQVKSLPSRPASVADALPLVPGVAREPNGGIVIAGNGEHRSALVVNAVDVTDPATGQFGLTIPVDSAEAIDVLKSPYLAQYGRFTSGVVSVETKRGGEKWNFELNDPLPEFRIRSLRLRGLKEFVPRVVLNGPLIPGRLYFSEGFEYAMRKEAVRTLPFPQNETKRESLNSFTQLDYIASPTHTLTETFHFAPHHVNYVNLNFFNPQPVTPSFRARDWTNTLIDRLTLGSHLLETIVAVKRSASGVWGQGNAEMVLTPTGNRGHYFGTQRRRSSRIEWLEMFSVKPLTMLGSHRLKFGSTLTKTTNEGFFAARPVNILDAAGRRLKRIEFAGTESYNRDDLEFAAFAQDHWTMGQRFALDIGVRAEQQAITGTFRAAPRAGVAWTPFHDQRTVVRGGAGFFYDRVPLNIFAFNRFPDQIVTTYGADGQVRDGPRRFYNLIAHTGHKFPFVRDSGKDGDFAPYSVTWNVEVERPVTSFLRVRANYLQGNSSGVVILMPKVVRGVDSFVLGGNGKSRYRQLELTSRLNWKDQHELVLSYVRSRAEGDLNQFNNYLGNFPFPVVRPNRFARLPGDLPHRFLAWGVMKFPQKIELAPIVEVRSGFPYTRTDAAQNYVGTPNSLRFPRFFSLDGRLSKDFQVSKDYALKLSVSGYNLTNHFNALDVRANIADPGHGVFFGNYRRRFRVDFDVIF